MNEKEEIYSFSKISAFEQCPYQYFLRYVLKEEQTASIFTLAGTSTHNAIEDIQERKLTTEEALSKWKDEMELHKILGFEFISEKSEKNFKECVEHYIENFKPLNGDVEVEKKFNLNVGEHKIKGFIDLLVKDGNHIKIYDLKTSTIYKPKDIEHYKHQLVLYALGMEEQGYTVDEVGWVFMKYATIQGKKKEKHILRNELVNDEYKDCIITYPLSDETKQDTIEWATSLIKEIESNDLFGEWEQKKDSFYCSKLCGFKDSCNCALELRDRYFKGR